MVQFRETPSRAVAVSGSPTLACLSQAVIEDEILECDLVRAEGTSNE